MVGILTEQGRSQVCLPSGRGVVVQSVNGMVGILRANGHGLSSTGRSVGVGLSSREVAMEMECNNGNDNGNDIKNNDNGNGNYN